jgi:hypothetical protein
MKRLLLLTAALAVLVPSAALGELPLKISDHGTTCKSSGTQISCSGKLSGLGSATTIIEIRAAFACTNRGGNQPPGQVSGQSGPITPQNGQVTFTNVTTSAASCPDDMAPTFGPTATLNVYQGGALVFTEQVPIT